MAISATDFRALFTKELIDVYQERIRPTSFLRSFFPTVTSPTKNIAIEATRGFEKISIDTIRGTEGNRNQFSKSTEKLLEPPFYREYVDITQFDLYERVVGSQGNAQAPLFAALLNTVADRLGELQDKIERSYERQCAQVFEDSIVTLISGDNIDFKRKSASIVDPGGGNYFANNVDVFAQFEAACTFLRTVGKSGDATFNAILGSTALQDLYKNTVFLARQDTVNMSLDAVVMPERTATGAAYHGMISAGPYKVQLWSYPQFYDDPDTGASTSYVNPKKVYLFPTMPRFKLSFAAVPKLISRPGEMPTQGAYVIGEHIDEWNTTHLYDVKSAGLAIPVAVDQIYTLKAVA